MASGNKDHTKYEICFERDLELAKLYEENKYEDNSKEFCRSNKNYMFRMFLEDGERRKNCLQKYEGTYWLNEKRKKQDYSSILIGENNNKSFPQTCICDHVMNMNFIKTPISCVCFSKNNKEVLDLGNNGKEKKCVYPHILRLSNFVIKSNKGDGSHVQNSYKVSINEFHMNLSIEHKIIELLKQNRINLTANSTPTATPSPPTITEMVKNDVVPESTEEIQKSTSYKNDDLVDLDKYKESGNTRSIYPFSPFLTIEDSLHTSSTIEPSSSLENKIKYKSDTSKISRFNKKGIKKKKKSIDKIHEKIKTNTTEHFDILIQESSKGAHKVRETSKLTGDDRRKATLNMAIMNQRTVEMIKKENGKIKDHKKPSTFVISKNSTIHLPMKFATHRAQEHAFITSDKFEYFNFLNSQYVFVFILISLISAIIGALTCFFKEYTKKDDDDPLDYSLGTPHRVFFITHYSDDSENF